MVDREHPCARGLTPECFEAYPEWAKRAFAYRLMHTLFPGRITRLLPRVLWEPLIGEGVEIPPDVVIPPGVVIPPEFPWDPVWPPWLYFDFEPWLDPEKTFPPGWTPADPLPPGVEIDPGVLFPPGWTPGDPLPPGVVVPPGVVFPPGWTPDLPLPPGVTIDPVQILPPGWDPGVGGPPPIMLRPNLPPEAVESGPAPPAYARVWEPGPVHRPPQYPWLVLPEITGFWIGVMRGDGTIITPDQDGYFDVYNSSEDWISSTEFSYDPTTKYWKVEIAEEDIDPNGYFVFIDYDDGIEVQFPDLYKSDDQWKVEDLIGFGQWTAFVPYWVVGAGAWDNPKDYTYPTSPDEVGWSDAVFPPGWGTTHITLYFIRHGWFTTIDETVDANTWRMTVKSSIPYQIRYYGTPQGFHELFWAYTAGSFDDDCHYKLTTSEGDEKVVVAEGLGLSVYHEYEGNVEGREHSILWELTHKTSLADYKVVAADKSPICFIYNDYDW